MVMQGMRASTSNGSAWVPPVASKAKDYTERPEEVTDELDELRTRGIAKVLYKHFTDTTKQLAKEKAQADAALADLERRRAQTKEFVPSKGGELNPYDKLYIQLQQKRAECRRKEKETMMLYQRYVLKYGKSGKARQTAKAPSTGQTSVSDVQLYTMKALDTLDENTETNFFKSVTRRKETDQTPKHAERRSKEREKEDAVQVNHFMSALSNFMADDGIHEDSKAIDKMNETSERKTSASLSRVLPTSPTPSSPAPEVKIFMSAVSNFISSPNIEDPNESEVVQHQHHKSEEEETKIELNVKTIEDKELTENSEKVEPTTTTSAVAVQDEDEGLVDTGMVTKSRSLGKGGLSIKTEPSKMLDAQHGMIANHQVDNRFHPTTRNYVTEKDLSQPPPTACMTISDDVQHTETPSFATTTVDEDVDDRSIISGLTSVNSALTRQVLDEIEEEMEDFIKTETEAIRKVLDTEEELSASNQTASSSLLGDASEQVTIRAEAMAREMQRILDEFATEDAPIAAPSSADVEVAADEGTTEAKKYPHKFEPAVPGEDWYVYYDDNYKREFYVEKKANRTQWDYPTSAAPRVEPRISSDDFLSDIQSVASSRGGSLSRRSYRRSLYRRQRRKRRTQRLLVSFFSLFCVLASVFHWRVRYPDLSFSGAMHATISSVHDIDVEGAITYAKDQFEYAFTDRRKREEEEKAREIERAQRERRERKLAAKRARDEAARKAKEEAERKAREEAEKKDKLKAAREEEARREAERRASEEEERLRLAEKIKEESRRPWGCNIPFAYIIPRCNRFATVEPIIQESDFVFLQ